MSESREVTTTLDDVLSMVACAEDYGHTNQIAMHFLWTLAGEEVTDEEIEAFVQREYLSEGRLARGYGEEDADGARAAVRAWRDRHAR